MDAELNKIWDKIRDLEQNLVSNEGKIAELSEKISHLEYFKNSAVVIDDKSLPIVSVVYPQTLNNSSINRSQLIFQLKNHICKEQARMFARMPEKARQCSELAQSCGYPTGVGYHSTYGYFVLAHGDQETFILYLEKCHNQIDWLCEGEQLMDSELYKIWNKLQEIEEDLAVKEQRISDLESRLEEINPTLSGIPTSKEHAPSCPRALAWDVTEALCTCNYSDYDEDQILYAIGLSSDGEQFGMTYGPTPNLESILSITDADERKDLNAYIIRFQGEDSTPIYIWDSGTEQWISLES